MAIDTRQKRMSAINPACPWRGPMVVPTGSASQAIRQAANFMYSGIDSGAAAGPYQERVWVANARPTTWVANERGTSWVAPTRPTTAVPDPR